MTTRAGVFSSPGCSRRADYVEAGHCVTHTCWLDFMCNACSCVSGGADIGYDVVNGRADRLLD